MDTVAKVARTDIHGEIRDTVDGEAPRPNANLVTSATAEHSDDSLSRRSRYITAAMYLAVLLAIAVGW